MRSILCATCLFSLSTSYALSSERLVDYVNPMLGTANAGHVFPGALEPFGIVLFGLDTDQYNIPGVGVDNTAGYTSNGRVIGFSHLHTSGTGGTAKYGLGASQFPQTGPLDEVVLFNYSLPRTDANATDSARPGYFHTLLNSTHGNITAELTASRRASMARYTFPADAEAHVTIDSARSLYDYNKTQVSSRSYIEIMNETTVWGYGSFFGGWNEQPEQFAFDVFFCTVFDQNASQIHTVDAGKKLLNISSNNTLYYQGATRPIGGSGASAVFSFDPIQASDKPNRTVQIRTGISFLSINQACQNLETEIPVFDFDTTQTKAAEAWEAQLSRVQLETSKTQKRIFYTAMYHTLIMPTNKTLENPHWPSSASQPYWDNFYTFWDIFRTLMPWYFLSNPSIGASIVQSLVTQYKYRGFLPGAQSGFYPGMTRGGSCADYVLAEALLKNCLSDESNSFNINKQDLYSALQSDQVSTPPDNGMHEGRPFLSLYNKYGYIPSDISDTYSVTRTLENAAADYSISLVATSLNDSRNAEIYEQKSENWRNLFTTTLSSTLSNSSTSSTAFPIPRFSNGTQLPLTSNSLNIGRANDQNLAALGLYEATPWTYSFFVPQNIPGLVNLTGGPIAFSQKLDEYFRADENGTYLYFDPTNEPSYLIPELYHWVSRPSSSTRQNHAVTSLYSDDIGGIPGNDDAGAQSSIYIWRALGIFPVGGQDLYLINGPVGLSQASIDMGWNRTLKIVAYGQGEGVRYVQRVVLNGVEWGKSWFRHGDIVGGAVLEIWLGGEEGNWTAGGEVPVRL